MIAPAPPGFIRPCRPVLSLKVPGGDGWIHELKHDDFRIIAQTTSSSAHKNDRNGRSPG